MVILKLQDPPLPNEFQFLLMRHFIFIFLLSFSFSSMAQSGTATTVKKTFNRTTSITETINADPAKIWEVLTNASLYPSWNSTVISLEGEIKLGEKVRLKSTLDSSRVFKLKVKEMVPNTKMVWGDAMGNRTYILEKKGESTLFTMTEKIGGPMFPLFAGKIPSFDESFEQFTADLKLKAESKAGTN